MGTFTLSRKTLNIQGFSKLAFIVESLKANYNFKGVSSLYAYGLTKVTILTFVSGF